MSDAPDGLSVGDTYALSGLEYQVLELTPSTAIKYYVQLVGKASEKVSLANLQDPYETRSALIVEDATNPDSEGLWVRIGETYVKFSTLSGSAAASVTVTPLVLSFTVSAISGGFGASLGLSAGAPAKLYYRVIGSSTWLEHLPSHDTDEESSYAFNVSGLADGNYEIYATDHIGGTYTTPELSITLGTTTVENAVGIVGISVNSSVDPVGFEVEFEEAAPMRIRYYPIGDEASALYTGAETSSTYGVSAANGGVAAHVQSISVTEDGTYVYEIQSSFDAGSNWYTVTTGTFTVSTAIGSTTPTIIISGDWEETVSQETIVISDDWEVTTS